MSDRSKKHRSLKAGCVPRDVLKQRLLDQCLSRIKSRRKDVVSRYRAKNTPDRVALVNSLLVETFEEIQYETSSSDALDGRSAFRIKADAGDEGISSFQLDIDDVGFSETITTSNSNSALLIEGDIVIDSTTLRSVFDHEEFTEMMIQLENAVQYELEMEQDMLTYNYMSEDPFNIPEEYGECEGAEYVICPVCRSSPLDILIEGDVAACRCGASFNLYDRAMERFLTVPELIEHLAAAFDNHAAICTGGEDACSRDRSRPPVDIGGPQERRRDATVAHANTVLQFVPIDDRLHAVCDVCGYRSTVL